MDPRILHSSASPHKQSSFSVQSRGASQTGWGVAMEENFMVSLSIQGGAVDSLGKRPPKRSIFPEYWKQTNKIRSESLRKRPSSPLTLSTHSRESLDRTIVVESCTN